MSAALLGAACLPDEPPFWVIDHTDVLGMRLEVVAAGPYGSDTPAAGGPVLEAMPGDRVRVTAFVAGPDGPVPTASLRPRFYACAQASCDEAIALAEAAPPCGAVALPNEETCLLGQGDAVEFEIGPMRDVVAAINLGVPVMMVAGTPEGPDTAECVRRLAGLEERSASLRDCLLFVRNLRIGPAWRALLVGALTGAATPLRPDQLPWDVVRIEPDVPPRIAGLTARVPAPGGGERPVELAPGGTLTVGTGDQVALSLVAADEPQTYVLLAIDPDGGDATASAVTETRAAAWFATAPAPFFLDSAQGLDVTWTAPDEPGVVFLYVVLADVRSADAAWLRVEVVAG